MTCLHEDGVPADELPGLDAIDATLHTNHGVRTATASGPRRYALPWFKALFATGVGRAPASNDMEQRLENLNVFFTYFVYTNVLTRRQKST